MKNAIAIAIVVVAIAATAHAADWPHWRGPNFNGSVEAKGLPTDFSREKGVKWSVDLPGASGATPVIAGDRVFISSVDTKRQKLVAICVDRNSGKILWQDDAGSGYLQPGASSPIAQDSNNNFSSSSPVTDGKVVVFTYGNGDMVAYDVSGKRVWARNIQKDYGDFSYQWTYSASPTIFGGKLYLPVLQRNVPVKERGKAGNESFLLAIDPATGNTIWKHVRPSDAIVESLESYATPIPYEYGGRTQLIIVGGDYITGHDPATGQELWRWGTWNAGHKEQWWRLVPSAVAGDGVALACAPKKAPVYAVKIPESMGEQARPLWNSEASKAVASDVPTPAFANGSFYILNDQRPFALSRVEPKTGKVIWTTDMPGKFLYRSSPTVADGKVFSMNYAGDVVIVDAESGKLLNTIAMGSGNDDYAPASVAVAADQIFIRTQTKLWCVGK